MWSKGLLIGVAATAAMVASTAQAQSTVYGNANSFNAATIGVTIETFDSQPSSALPATTAYFTVSGGGGGGFVDNALYASGKSLVYSTTSMPITFTFNSAISAFGFDVFDLGTVGATTLTATYNGISTVLKGGYTGLEGNTFFTGFTDAANPFTTVTIANTASGDFVEFDNVRGGIAASMTAAVPEPATWAMMIMGFGLAGFALRRHQGKVTTRVRFA